MIYILIYFCSIYLLFILNIKLFKKFNYIFPANSLQKTEIQSWNKLQLTLSLFHKIFFS